MTIRKVQQSWKIQKYARQVRIASRHHTSVSWTVNRTTKQQAAQTLEFFLSVSSAFVNKTYTPSIWFVCIFPNLRWTVISELNRPEPLWTGRSEPSCSISGYASGLVSAVRARAGRITFGGARVSDDHVYRRFRGARETHSSLTGGLPGTDGRLARTMWARAGVLTETGGAHKHRQFTGGRGA